MKNIIVPTDFSECFYNALRVAASIARKAGSVITLVHMYERPVYGFVDLSYDNEAEKEILEKIDHEIVTIMKSDFLRGIPLKKLLLTDISFVEMVENKKIKNADLIVMGSHGASGIKELLIGSNTEKIIRIADLPVLVIKEKAEKFSLSSMTYASTFDQESDDSFSKIQKFASVFNPVIHLLKVNTRNHFEKTPVSLMAMDSFAKECGLKNYTLNTWNDNTIEDGILNFSNHIKTDVIALETHGRTGIAHIIQGSITENLANHVNKPVLSVRREEVKTRYVKKKAASRWEEPNAIYRPLVV